MTTITIEIDSQLLEQLIQSGIDPNRLRDDFYKKLSDARTEYKQIEFVGRAPQGVEEGMAGGAKPIFTFVLASLAGVNLTTTDPQIKEFTEKSFNELSKVMVIAEVAEGSIKLFTKSSNRNGEQ